MIGKKVIFVFGIISLLISINTSYGLAPAALDFSSGVSGYPGDTVFLDIALTNNFDFVAGLNFDVDYDAGILELVDIQIGAAADAAGKSVEYNNIYQGKERCIIYGINQNHIADGFHQRR